MYHYPPPPDNRTFVATLLEERRRKGVLEWWYSLTAPSEPPISANLEQREKTRRGRLTSTILLVELLILFSVLLMSFITGNMVIQRIMVAGIGIAGIALYCNRRGFLVLAGLILLCQIDIGMTVSFTHFQGGLDPGHLVLLDQYIIADLVVLSFFPDVAIFGVAFLNSVLLVLVLKFAPHTASLTVLLSSNAWAEVYLDPLLLQVIVAVVSFLWTRSANRAIQRADRAEMVATLEHQIAEQAHILAQREGESHEQNRQLRASIQQILHVHVQVANGNTKARVPLTRENVLWPLAGSLNTLLSRYELYRQEASESRKLRGEIDYFASLLHQSKITQIPIQAVLHGTALDRLYLESNGAQLVPRSFRQKDTPLPSTYTASEPRRTSS